jgi:hypothetical protein
MSVLYFEKVRERISELRWLIKRESTEVEWDEDADVGMIGGNIIFKDDSVLHFKEVILGGERHYRYHYMNNADTLICRWDTAPHHREVNSFPFHIHLPHGVEESKEIDLIFALNKIEQLVVESIDL